MNSKTLKILSIVTIVSFCLVLLLRKKMPAQHDLKRAAHHTNLIPVAIIGAGPAGLSAAVYTARAKIETFVFAGNEPGGQLGQIKHIENWPGKQKMTGSKLMRDLIEQAEKFGAYIVPEAIKEVDLNAWPFKLVCADGTVIHALSVIIATGCVPKKLDVPGVEYYWGKGVSACAICDAPFNKDQSVFVIGGSDAAAELALQLAAYAKNVTLVVKEASLEACATVQDYLKAAKNVTILYSTLLERIVGDEASLSGVELKNILTQETRSIPAKAVYLATGYQPASTIFKPYIQTDKEGYILVQGRSQKTSLPGVFAAGSVEEKEYSKAGVASGNGIKAALDALAFLETIGLNSYTAESLKSNFYEQPEHQASEITSITNYTELETLIKNSTVPVIIDFFAHYCPSCLHLMPFIEDLAAQAGSTAQFCKVDIDKAPTIAKKLSVNALPLIVVFHHGQEQARRRHIQTKTELEEFLQPWITTKK